MFNTKLSNSSITHFGSAKARRIGSAGLVVLLLGLPLDLVADPSVSGSFTVAETVNTKK